MTEAVEMYLVMTALERKEDQPVHLSLLAERLSISPVSANEMCHKLAERGLVEYQPYKGVILTEQGELMAHRVLHRRRIWGIFLVQHLGIELEEAETIACQLEHISCDKLVDALAAFLHQPGPSSTETPDESTHETRSQPLTTLNAGQRSTIVGIIGDDLVKSFLRAQGIKSGTAIEVLVVGIDGSRLLDCAGHRLALAHSVAEHIQVTLV